MDRYSETLERIYNLREGVIDLRLERMERALALFDHPERRFAALHIAGTNGKGSTAAMVQRVLSLAGYRTALYTSPHLVSFTERMRVGVVQREVETIDRVPPNRARERTHDIIEGRRSAACGKKWNEQRPTHVLVRSTTGARSDHRPKHT